MTIQTLTELFGWMTVINIGILIVVVIMMIAMRKCISKIHLSLFDVRKEELPTIYFRFIAHYKLLIIFFNIVPYFAMKLLV